MKVSLGVVAILGFFHIAISCILIVRLIIMPVIDLPKTGWKLPETCFDMSQNHPPIIDELWYSIDWSVEELWALDLAVTALPLAALVWHLDVPIWPDSKGQVYSVTPRQVLDNKLENLGEFHRIRSADLRFPIEVIDREGAWMILDGIHRLTRAWAEGRSEIAVRIVPPEAVTWLDNRTNHRRKSED